MGPLIAIESNDLNPSHSAYTYPLRFLLFSFLKDNENYLRWLSDMFSISFGMGIAQWVHLFSMDFDDSRPFLLCFSLK